MTTETQAAFTAARQPGPFARCHARWRGRHDYRHGYTGTADAPYIHAAHTRVQHAEAQLTEQLHQLLNDLDQRLARACTALAQHHTVVNDYADSADAEADDATTLVDQAAVTGRRARRHHQAAHAAATAAIRTEQATIAALLTHRSHMVDQARAALDTHIAAADTLIRLYRDAAARRTQTAPTGNPAPYTPRHDWYTTTIPVPVTQPSPPALAHPTQQ